MARSGVRVAIACSSSGAAAVGLVLVDVPGGEVGLGDGVPVRVAELVERVDRGLQVGVDGVVVALGGVEERAAAGELRAQVAGDVPGRPVGEQC